jgi:hypothetical protein
MNDLSELWSLPWHALQRRLALGLGAATPIYIPPGHSRASVRPAQTQSWLMRAHAMMSLPASR